MSKKYSFACTGVTIIVAFALIVYLFMGAWKSAGIAALAICIDIGISTYREARRNKKSKGTL